MQVRIQPRFTQQEAGIVWHAMLDEVNSVKLMYSRLSATLLKLGLLLTLLGAALAVSWSQTSTWTLGAAYVAIALLLAQFAFIGHDAGHSAVSRRPSINRALGQISMTVVTGLAFDEWIERHRAHHRFCQDQTRDPDMAVDLVVSLTEASKRQKGKFGRFMTRYQAIHIWLLSLLFGHSQRHLSQAAVFVSPRRYALDAIVLLLHFALWFGLPCFLLGVPFMTALLAYVIPLTILGPYLAAIFWVNHVGMPLIERPEDFSFFEHQYVTSRTIINPPMLNWVFGGLNFQIEHHLFPRVPSSRLAAVQAIVRKHFARNRIEYHAVTWWGAMRAVAAHLHVVARAP